MKTKCLHCETQNDVNSKYCSKCGYLLPVMERKALPEIKEATTKERRKIDFKTVLIAVAAALGTLYFTPLFSPSFDSQLVSFANEINKTCPLSIDQFTTLKNVSTLPNKTVQYNYILINRNKDEVKLDTVKKYIFPNLLKNVKTNPGMKLFRDNKVTVIYSYSDKNGNFVTDYKINPEMYE